MSRDWQLAGCFLGCSSAINYLCAYQPSLCKITLLRSTLLNSLKSCFLAYLSFPLQCISSLPFSLPPFSFFCHFAPDHLLPFTRTFSYVSRFLILSAPLHCSSRTPVTFSIAHPRLWVCGHLPISFLFLANDSMLGHIVKVLVSLKHRNKTDTQDWAWSVQSGNTSILFPSSQFVT